jgi:hypothetical protein
MSFDLGGIVSGVVKSVLPLAIDAVFPQAMLIPGLTNMVSNMLGDELGKAIDQVGKQSGMPNFLINDALSILKGVVSGQQQPCDSGILDHVKDQFGGPVKSVIDDLICDFKDILKKYMNEQKNCHGGGKGGNAGGAAGPVDFRSLVLALAELEQKEAQNVADKVKKAGDALGVATSGKPEDSQKDANVRADQFRATEESKAEAQIFQAVADAVKAVIDGFGGALKTSARGQ